MSDWYWKSRGWRIYRATTGKWHQISIWFEDSVKGFGVQIEILASVFDWISKQQLNLSLFLWDWYCRKLGLTDLPGHDGKVTSAINFILSPYYRSFRADRDFLYESLLNSRLLWAKTWNNEYESEYESVSRISIWINFPPKTVSGISVHMVNKSKETKNMF